MVDLSDFKHGGTNITGLRLVDPNREDVQRVVDEWIRVEARLGRNLLGLDKRQTIKVRCVQYVVTSECESPTAL